MFTLKKISEHTAWQLLQNQFADIANIADRESRYKNDTEINTRSLLQLQIRERVLRRNN
jgi:hypothetical protein